MATPIRDTDWIREANLLPEGAISQDDMYYREYSPAAFKFTDTTLGGNFALNSPPQFCTNADPVVERYIDVLTRTQSDLPYDPGMGRWYSEVIDDNAVLIHMRFGLPVYNSLWQFFGNFYNSDAASIARTGKSQGFFNLIGKAIGWAFSVRMMPLILTGTAWKFFTGTTNTRFMYLKPMMGLYWKYVSDIANTLASYMEMTAQTSESWMAFADKMPKDGNGQNFEVVAKAVAAQTMANNDDEINAYAAMLPDIYKSKDGNRLLSGIDIYSVSTRAQRLGNAFHKAIKDNAQANATNANGVVSAIHKWMTGGQATTDLRKALNSPNYKLAEDYLSDYFQRQGKAGGVPTGGQTTGTQTPAAANSDPASNPDAQKQATAAQQQYGQTKAQAETAARNNASGGSATPQYGQTQAQADAAAAVRAQTMGEQTTPNLSNGGTSSSIPAGDGSKAAAAASPDTQAAVQQGLSGSFFETVSDFFSAKPGNDTTSFGAILDGYEADGSGWVTFRINGRPSVNEQFGNSTRDSGVGQMINSISSSARELRSNFADGNFLQVPGVSTAVSAVTGAVSDFFSGLAPSLMVNGVAALGGNAFVDIPKHWDQASMSFQNVSIDMELRAPYGNNLSRFQCEIVPMVAAIAGTLPMATGAESHTAPFYCEWYCRGRGSSRLSLVRSLSIERGVTNAPWSPDGRYRGINIRMDMEDLSTVCAMPMQSVYSTFTLLDPTNWPRLLFPQDSTFSDYMANLSSCGLSEMVYRTNKFKRNFRKQVSAFSKVYSPSSIVNSVFDGYRGQILVALGKTDRS